MIMWLIGTTNATKAVTRQEKEESEPMSYLNPGKMASLIKAEQVLFNKDANAGGMTALSKTDMENEELTTEILSGNDERQKT